MIFFFKSFLKSIGADGSGGFKDTSAIKIKKLFKGSHLKVMCFLLLFTGCQSDVMISESRETRVVVDSFVQASAIEEIDVLIALDTSGSMHDNYDDVASGMEILRLDIEALTMDYQFGYITMDPTNLGYVGPYDSSSSPIDMLLAPSLLPAAGLEQGFGAAYSFLNSEDGYELVRPEADFLLFLISDEDEQSTITANLFKEWLDEEFQDVRHDVVCVVTPDDGRESSWSNDIGYKYIELSNLYGKDIIDIQEEDWSVWLSESSYLTERRDYVEISEEFPIQDSFAVYIDQAEIFEWKYNEDKNLIELAFVPDHGSLVEVGYKVYI